MTISLIFLNKNIESESDMGCSECSIKLFKFVGTSLNVFKDTFLTFSLKEIVLNSMQCNLSSQNISILQLLAFLNTRHTHTNTTKF